MKKLIALVAVLALAGCAEEPMPAGPAPVVSPSVAPSSARPDPATRRAEPPSTPPATVGSVPTVTAGAYCSPEGAVGRTAKGTRMTCKGPGKPRWRS